MASSDIEKQHSTTSHRPPSIYVRTLGAFEVLRHGLHVVWQGGTAGARQLPRAFAYLILRRGQPVQRDEIARAAGGHDNHYGDRGYVLTDLLRKLKDWGAEAALRQHKPGISLERDTCWRTDTDDLDKLLSDAQALEQAGQPAQATILLEDAIKLCGGNYLPLFLPGFDPLLDSERTHWNGVQEHTHRMLVRFLMAMPGEQQHQRAARIAGAAIRFDPADPDSYLFAAAAARHSHQEAAAQYYEQMAREVAGSSGADP